MVNRTNVDLRGANLTGADLSYARLLGADLRKAKLGKAVRSGTNKKEADFRERGSYGCAHCKRCTDRYQFLPGDNARWETGRVSPPLTFGRNPDVSRMTPALLSAMTKQ